MVHDKSNRHKQTLNHLNRIEGQLKVLKSYIQEDRSCQDIAQLTASITQSFMSLKVRTLEGFVLHQLMEGKASENKQRQLTEILKLYKK
ncbi:metal-sensing transcriptional repressor [Candidatus Nomurabacteria bacterium]|nr:metal-sensing transcriptional repressor [Candidatus Woesebacteria bacterium]MCB9826697.1 metal-sensing transcriptional repressor [Candidatus Nomurabacteria bacterium]